MIEYDYFRDLIIFKRDLYVLINEDESVTRTAFEIVERGEANLVVDQLKELVDANVGLECCGFEPEQLRQGEYMFYTQGISRGYSGQVLLHGKLKYYDPKTGKIRDILDYEPQKEQHEGRGHEYYNPLQSGKVFLTFQCPATKVRTELPYKQ